MTLDVARPSQLLQMKVLSVLKLVVHCAGRGPAYLYFVPAREVLTRMHDGSVFCTRVYLRRYLKVCGKRLDDFPHGLSCGAPKGSRRPHEGLRRRGRVCTLRLRQVYRILAYFRAEGQAAAVQDLQICANILWIFHFLRSAYRPRSESGFIYGL